MAECVEQRLGGDREPGGAGLCETMLTPSEVASAASEDAQPPVHAERHPRVAPTSGSAKAVDTPLTERSAVANICRKLLMPAGHLRLPRRVPSW